MNQQAVDLIVGIIEELFQKTKLRLLGPEYVSKAFLFSNREFDPANTLASLYVHAVSNHSVSKDSLDPSTIKKINDTFNSYIDVIGNKTKENAATTLKNFIHEADVKAKLAGILTSDFLRTEDGMKIRETASEAVSQIVEKTQSHVDRLVINEMHNAQSLGALDGIVGLSKSLGIDDPVVFKVGVIDESMCKVCRKLWHLETNIQVPKLYKLSELRGGYEDMKNPTGTITMTHPHCRHVLTTLLPGFGFKDSGHVTFIGTGHDEYAKQNA